jgi:hypothetical protein
MNIIQEWYQADQTKAPRMMRIMRSLISYVYCKGDSPTLIDLYISSCGCSRGTIPS